MHFEFQNPGLHAPALLVAEASIVFDDASDLRGLRLAGFSIWQHKDGKLTATFPSRAYQGTDGKKHHYWFLRSNSEEDQTAVFVLRARLLEAYRSWAS